MPSIAAGVISCAEIRQPADIHLLARERKGTDPISRAHRRFAIRRIGLSEGDVAACIGQLTD